MFCLENVIHLSRVGPGRPLVIGRPERGSLDKGPPSRLCVRICVWDPFDYLTGRDRNSGFDIVGL